MSFREYLRRVSLGGLISVLAVVPLMPLLMKELWHTQRTLPPPAPPRPLPRPWFTAFVLAVLAAMVFLFIFGEDLPTRLIPPAVAVIAASLALAVVFESKTEPVDNVVRDVDWKTLLFLACIFCLVEAFSKTGLLQSLALKLYEWFGTALVPVALLMIAGIGVLSSLLANIPVVAGSLLMVKGYLVAGELVPEDALLPQFADWPAATIPVFVAMMFGATLGGNATLIGASANVVAAGICAGEGRRVSFGRFLRYGLPITVFQLGLSAIYVLAMFWMTR
jgi:Na+/H+ antiporter NhaD/arsenite permease-like protein